MTEPHSNPITLGPCVDCGYDLSGSASAANCPECGLAIQATLESTAFRAGARIRDLQRGVALLLAAIPVGLFFLVAGVLLFRDVRGPRGGPLMAACELAACLGPVISWRGCVAIQKAATGLEQQASVMSGAGLVEPARLGSLGAWYAALGLVSTTASLLPGQAGGRVHLWQAVFGLGLNILWFVRNACLLAWFAPFARLAGSPRYALYSRVLGAAALACACAVPLPPLLEALGVDVGLSISALPGLWYLAWLIYLIDFWFMIRRQRRVGRCPGCGYSLQGLPGSAPCPECGRAARS